MTLDDPGTFQRADPHRVAEILAAFPAQCREAQALRCEPPVPRERPSLVIIAGMGGSAAGPAALARELGPTRATAQNEAKRLALAIGDRLPAVYGGPATGAVAYRWKTDLEENAKLLAVAGTLPEMTHNEIEAWRGPAARDRHLVLLREEGEPREIARRFAVLHDLIGPAAGGVSECWARGTGRAARLLALAYVGMWVSYYAAIARGVDPWPVPLLDEVKRRLA